ncbi:MAG: hypothetical protein U1E65_25730 [Myxococcota bacterium]
MRIQAWLGLALGLCSCADPGVDRPPEAPQILRFSAVPFDAPLPYTAQIEWEVRGEVDSIRLEGAADEVLDSPSGTRSLEVRAPTALRLVAVGPGGTRVAALALGGVAARAARILSFSVEPTRAAPGDPVLLRWSTADAERASLHVLPSEPILLDAPPTGSLRLRASHSGTIELSAFGQGPPVTATIGLSVFELPPEILSFTATPIAAHEGEEISFAWEVTRANIIEIIDEEAGPIQRRSELSGTVGLSLSGHTRRFTLVASRGSAEARSTLVVHLLGSGAPEIRRFTLTPTVTGPGGDVRADIDVLGAQLISLRDQFIDFPVISAPASLLVTNNRASRTLLLIAGAVGTLRTRTATLTVDPNLPALDLQVETSTHGTLVHYQAAGARQVSARTETGAVLIDTASSAGSLFLAPGTAVWLDALNGAGRTSRFVAP